MFLRAFLLSICLSLPAFAGEKWNVLFLISDDLRPELGCYGSKLAKTPNIDALAQHGVRFDRAYCQFPLCNPSRASLLTGRRPTVTKVLGNRTWFGDTNPDLISLPKLFRQNGYVTIRAGKIFHGGIDDTDAWTVGGESRKYSETANATAAEKPVNARKVAPNDEESEPVDGAATAKGPAKDRGSDRIIILPDDASRHGDTRAADRAIEFLREHRESSFFLGCGFVKPHSPPTAPQRFFDLYDVATIPLPQSFKPRPTVPEGFPKASIRAKNADLFIGRDATETEAREMTRAYLASISFMDWNVGRVLAELDALGLREKTIIVFWGDHGYHLGEMGKWSKAGSLFELGTRCPLIIALPKAAGNGQGCPRVVEAVDVYQTLCELCRITPPSGTEGRSLAPFLQQPQLPSNRPAFSIWSEDGKSVWGATVRTERYRYAKFLGGGGGAMLFDETADPAETTNRFGDPTLADVQAELVGLLERYLAGL